MKQAAAIINNNHMLDYFFVLVVLWISLEPSFNFLCLIKSALKALQSATIPHSLDS